MNRAAPESTIACPTRSSIVCCVGIEFTGSISPSGPSQCAAQVTGEVGSLVQLFDHRARRAHLRAALCACGGTPPSRGARGRSGTSAVWATGALEAAGQRRCRGPGPVWHGPHPPWAPSEALAGRGARQRSATPLHPDLQEGERPDPPRGRATGLVHIIQDLENLRPRAVSCGSPTL
ncbi:unnamed protein product [Prorocentrum cordatum]|uniref:Uncharacterized protein n=1 Tax=Prorocentrum cordatum TaxID=2364126 RepID=A0ABN9S077_9DINO|nr:unnamed protein product [Polarella glacialis]